MKATADKQTGDFTVEMSADEAERLALEDPTYISLLGAALERAVEEAMQ